MQLHPAFEKGEMARLWDLGLGREQLRDLAASRLAFFAQSLALAAR